MVASLSWTLLMFLDKALMSDAILSISSVVSSHVMTAIASFSFLIKNLNSSAEFLS